jgi:hypothetical protein
MLRKCEEASREFEKSNKNISDDDDDDEEEEMEDYRLEQHFAFKFWLNVTTQYMKTGGLPQRLFALDQIASLDRRAQKAEPSPSFLRVHGSGDNKVDGVYYIQGKHKGYDKW